MNRKQKRKALSGSQQRRPNGFRQPPKDTTPVIKRFDPASMFRLKYDLSVPGGLLRDDNPVQVAGVLEARSEADLMRGIIVKLLDTYGFTPHDRAVQGIMGDVFNPLPKRLRGGIAFCLIEGHGLFVTLDEEDVCDDPKCAVIMERGIHPDPPEDTPEEELPLLIDITRHAPECHVNREVDPEHPERPLRPATYKREPVVTIVNPRNYEPLTNKAIDPETGEVSEPLQVPEPEAGGDESTLPDEPFVVVEEDGADAGIEYAEPVAEEAVEAAEG